MNSVKKVFGRIGIFICSTTLYILLFLIRTLKAKSFKFCFLKCQIEFCMYCTCSVCAFTHKNDDTTEFPLTHRCVSYICNAGKVFQKFQQYLAKKNPQLFGTGVPRTLNKQNSASTQFLNTSILVNCIS